MTGFVIGCVHSFCVVMQQIGEAISKNPGYLKLKKIRAAQNIARTVKTVFCLC